MKKLKAMLLVPFLAPCLSVASESPFYLGLGYGSADYENKEEKDALLDPNQSVDADTDFVEIYGGYRLNEHFSFELGYADYDDANLRYAKDPDQTSIVAPNTLENADMSKWSIGGVAELPVLDKLSVIGVLGYSFYDIDRTYSGGFHPEHGDTKQSSSDSEEGFYYGIGLKYDFTDRVAARVQWVEDDPANIDVGGYRFSVEVGF